MINSQRSNQSNNPPDLSSSAPRRAPSSIQDNQDIFGFLKKEYKPRKSSSFFSNNGLSQDIIQLTHAEPDVCLEVFYALYHTLWAEIERQSDGSLKNAWMKFLGGSSTKGSLCPPEKLIAERRLRDIIDSLSSSEGEKRIFQELDQVLSSIENLKEKVIDYPDQLPQKKEILAALNLARTFYKDYRSKMKTLGETIIEKEKINVGYRQESDALEDLLEPKAIMMSDIFSHHWAYRVSRNQAQKLLSLNMYGRPLKSNLSDPSSHPVIALPENSDKPLVYFKANMGRTAIQPEKEFMLYSLYRHLQIPVPETALLILTDVFEMNSGYFYAVQASEAVNGESALKGCRDQETTFEEKAYALQVIGALLTNPSDGSFKNFKYSPMYKTLISIDNDLVFKPELHGKGNKAIVNIKSILYLLPQIESILPQSIQTFYTTLDPHLTIFSWLQDLAKKNREYQLLFTRLAFQKTRCLYQNLLPESSTPLLSDCLKQSVHVDSEIHGDSFYPKILVSHDLLGSLIEKLQIIEKTLLKNGSASPQVLFEEISPALGKYYRKLRFEFTDPEEALEAVWGVQKNGVDYSYISSLLNPEEFDQHKNQLASKQKIPEKFFKEYKNLLNSGEAPLDRFIKRQNSRKRRNVLNLQVALEELQFLIQEGLTNALGVREIVDFCHSLSKIADNDHKEIISLLSSLPHSELKWLLLLEKYFLRADRDVPKDLIPSSRAVFGAFMKQRTFLLTESEGRYLFDQQGNIQKNASLTGRSLVTFFPEKNPEFFLKQYPEWPGYEFASALFMRLIGVTHLAYQDLMILNSKYPVLLTQKVSGSPVLRVWQNPEAFSQLDPFHTGLLIISAMLLNPEDGKEDNFILSQDGRFLIPIDNDHCFLPSFSHEEASFWNAFTVNTALQTKTILFCLDEMKRPIDLKVKRHIRSIDFDKLLTSWLTELDKLENRFNNLIDQNQRERFLKQGTVMNIPFYKQFIHNIHWKAHKIQDILKNTDEPTPFDLLKAVEPFAARCYNDSFNQGSNLQTRFKAATKKLYTKTAEDGSRVSVLNTRSMMKIVNISEKDLQKDAMFQRMGPLDSLELLKEFIVKQSERSKIEQDFLCELNDQNKEGILAILFGKPLVETALKDFLASEKEGLLLKGSKWITSSKLKELFREAPNKGMRIRFLSLPDSPVLRDKEIRILAEGCPNLEYLNVSGCGGLIDIITEKKEWPLLARLEAKGCINLRKLVSYSPIKILRIETSRDMQMHVEKLTFDTFMISIQRFGFHFSLTKGEEFELKLYEKTISNYNFFRNEDEEMKKGIVFMYITTETHAISSRNDLAIFLTVIDLRDYNLKTEDMKRMKTLTLINLKRLDLARNKLKGTDYLEYLIQGDWPKLNHLNLSDNEIHDEGLEILVKGNWPLLEVLNLQETKITRAGIETIVKKAKWTKLKNLDISENELNDEELAALCQGNWPLLETLNLGSIGVTKKALFKLLLNLNWPNFKEINMNGHVKDFASSLLQKNWPLLEDLDLSYSEISKFEIEITVNHSKWPQLKHLNLSGNELNTGALEILCKGHWPQLETLDLQNTGVTKKKSIFSFLLNISWQNLKEIKFDAAENNFANSLLQKNWPFLEELDLSDSEISKFEIEIMIKRSKWPRLKHLNLSSNYDLNDEALEILWRGQWPQLETLNLENTDITKQALLRLLLNQNWPKLQSIILPIDWKNVDVSLVNCFIQKDLSMVEKLELNKCYIAAVELERILKEYKCSQLKYLNISYNNISFEEEEALVLAFGECSLLEELHIENIKFTAKGVETLVNQSKWQQLKHLNMSNNEVLDEGISAFTSAEWPLLEELNVKNTKITQKGLEVLVNQMKLVKLKKLDISENIIGNRGLKILASAEWLLFEHLVYYDTQVTIKGHVTLLENMKWPNLIHLEHSLSESFYDYDESQDRWSLSETILASVPMCYKKQSLLVLILDVNWLNSKEIYLTINHQGVDEKVMILPRNKLDELESVKISFTVEPKIKSLQSIILPSHVKTLDLSNNSLSDQTNLGNFLMTRCPQLENLCLSRTSLTSKSLEIFASTSDWSNLKKLDISHNTIQNEGLKMIFSRKWPLLEELNLAKIQINAEGIEILISHSDWPHLKRLDLSCNPIQNEGLEVLSCGKWSQLEELRLQNTSVTGKGIEGMANVSDWPNLKILDLSLNKNLFDEDVKSLALGKWPLLGCLSLKWTNIALKDVEILVNQSSWTNLKEFHFRGLAKPVEVDPIKALILERWPDVKTDDLKSRT